MLGLCVGRTYCSVSMVLPLRPIPNPKPFESFLHRNSTCLSLYPGTRTASRNPTEPFKRLIVQAADNSDDKKDNNNELKKDEEVASNGDVKEDVRPLFNLKLGELLNPDPDNILAVGLTGLLTWASVQVLWQLLFIGLAILVAAVKYSFIAAVLIFILITLL